MSTIVVRHKVGNFDIWIAGHEERKKVFSSAVSSFKTFQDTDDPTSVLIVMEVTDMEKLQSVLNDPDIEPAKKAHTVIEPIVLSTEVEV